MIKCPSALCCLCCRSLVLCRHMAQSLQTALSQCCSPHLAECVKMHEMFILITCLIWPGHLCMYYSFVSLSNQSQPAELMLHSSSVVFLAMLGMLTLVFQVVALILNGPDWKTSTNSWRFTMKFSADVHGAPKGESSPVYCSLDTFSTTFKSKFSLIFTFEVPFWHILL